MQRNLPIELLGVASIAAQVTGLAAYAWLLFDVFTFPDELVGGQSEESAFLFRIVVDTMVSYLAFVATGLAGAIITGILVWKGICRSRWFLLAAKSLGWIWMPLIPVGTIVGITLLRTLAAGTRNSNHR